MTELFAPFRRMFDGGVRSLQKKDHTYFTKACPRTGRSRFREDLRSIVGGGLAAAMIAAALVGLVHVPYLSDSEFVAAAAGVGALAGKFVLA